MSVCLCVCVRVCLRWLVNEAEVFALLLECVVSEDLISPQPQAWLQGLGRTASTDEFVSVIKAHSVSYAGTRRTHIHSRALAHSFYLKSRSFLSTTAYRFTDLISATQCIVTVTELAALQQPNNCVCVCVYLFLSTHLAPSCWPIALKNSF